MDPQQGLSGGALAAEVRILLELRRMRATEPLRGTLPNSGLSGSLRTWAPSGRATPHAERGLRGGLGLGPGGAEIVAPGDVEATARGASPLPSASLGHLLAGANTPRTHDQALLPIPSSRGHPAKAATSAGTPRLPPRPQSSAQSTLDAQKLRDRKQLQLQFSAIGTETDLWAQQPHTRREGLQPALSALDGLGAGARLLPGAAGRAESMRSLPPVQPAPGLSEPERRSAWKPMGATGDGLSPPSDDWGGARGLSVAASLASFGSGPEASGTAQSGSRWRGGSTEGWEASSLGPSEGWAAPPVSQPWRGRRPRGDAAPRLVGEASGVAGTSKHMGICSGSGIPLKKPRLIAGSTGASLMRSSGTCSNSASESLASRLAQAGPGNVAVLEENFLNGQSWKNSTAGNGQGSAAPHDQALLPLGRPGTVEGQWGLVPGRESNHVMRDSGEATVGLKGVNVGPACSGRGMVANATLSRSPDSSRGANLGPPVGCDNSRGAEAGCGETKEEARPEAEEVTTPGLGVDSKHWDGVDDFEDEWWAMVEETDWEELVSLFSVNGAPDVPQRTLQQERRDARAQEKDRHPRPQSGAAPRLPAPKCCSESAVPGPASKGQGQAASPCPEGGETCSRGHRESDLDATEKVPAGSESFGDALATDEDGYDVDQHVPRGRAHVGCRSSPSLSAPHASRAIAGVGPISAARRRHQDAPRGGQCRSEAGLVWEGTAKPGHLARAESEGGFKGLSKRAASEKRRRQKICDALLLLRQTVHGRGDNAAVLLQAVEHINSLKEKAHRLRTTLKESTDEARTGTD